MTLVQGIASEFPAVAEQDVWALEKQHEAPEYSQISPTDRNSVRSICARTRASSLLAWLC